MSRHDLPVAVWGPARARVVNFLAEPWGAPATGVGMSVLHAVQCRRSCGSGSRVQSLNHEFASRPGQCLAPDLSRVPGAPRWH